MFARLYILLKTKIGLAQDGNDFQSLISTGKSTVLMFRAEITTCAEAF